MRLFFSGIHQTGSAVLWPRREGNTGTEPHKALALHPGALFCFRAGERHQAEGTSHWTKREVEIGILGFWSGIFGAVYQKRGIWAGEYSWIFTGIYCRSFLGWWLDYAWTGRDFIRLSRDHLMQGWDPSNQGLGRVLLNIPYSQLWPQNGRALWVSSYSTRIRPHHKTQFKVEIYPMDKE